MDMFMDKLAQKLTAQEIIKANTVAETEELNQLRNQVKEYNDCLAKLQRLINDGAANLSGTGEANKAEISRLVNESIQKIRAMQQETAGLEQLQKTLTDKLDAMNASVEKKMDSMDTSVNEKLESMSGVLAGTLAEKLDGLEEKLASSPDEKLYERLSEVEQNVHKECVKVYRNVQAVVVEESDKQNEVIEKTASAANSYGGKLSVVLGVSIAALTFSLVSVIFQILNILNISVFNF